MWNFSQLHSSRLRLYQANQSSESGKQNNNRRNDLDANYSSGDEDRTTISATQMRCQGPHPVSLVQEDVGSPHERKDERTY